MMMLFSLKRFSSFIYKPKSNKAHRLKALLALLLSAHISGAQNSITLSGLNFFKTPSSSWKMAGDVTAAPYGSDGLKWSKGDSIIVNAPGKKEKGADLISTLEHGDIDLEMDYLVPKGSNSGMYLQGRYEIQLSDSWKTLQSKYNDNGGIYERWNEAKPEGSKGYDGHPPRQNVSRAPGLWQHLKISFQAPRFDGNGHKIENAKIVSAILNGVVIHENVELSGPTRGALSAEEVAMGPLRLQGDHGEVAFKNIQITHYGKSRPEISNLTYEVFKGKYETEPDYRKLPPEAKGSTDFLSAGINTIPNEFLLKFSGTLKVKEAGDYVFNMNAPGGRGYFKINNKVLVPYGESGDNRHIQLPAGNIPFEILYAKFVSYVNPLLDVMVSGPGIRQFRLSDGGISPTNAVDPIFVKANVNTILRSFVDLPSGIRMMHAVNVGSPQQVHYTYDMENAAIAQLWRGGFLDATPMWYDRGDGSARATGSTLYFGNPALSLARLRSADAPWITDTANTGYTAKGYLLDKANRPAFRYLQYGTTVMDAIRVMEEGDGIRREISLLQPINELYVRIAANQNIQALSNELFVVGDKAYYIQIDSSGGLKPILRNASGGKELIIPIQDKLVYSVLF